MILDASLAPTRIRPLYVRQSVFSGMPGQATSRTMTFPQVPMGTVLYFGTHDSLQGMYAITHSGYRYWFSSCSGGAATGNVGSATIGFGVPSAGAGGNASKTVTIYGAASTNDYPETAIIEIPGLIGEVLWAGQATATNTTLAAPAPKYGIWTPNCLLICVSRFRSGGAGGASVVLSNGQTGSWTPTGSLGSIQIFRYIPGSRPVATWTFARSTASSVMTLIVR